MHRNSAAEVGGEQAVELCGLVERARSGDSAAFTVLVRRYQEMALGYALTLLHDFHLAQDVTQEALVVAYHRLPSLDEDDRFPAWLRGIVRHQCGRILRKRTFDLMPLEYAYGVATSMPGPEQHLEIKEGFHRVLAAIRALPEPQRDVAMLFYIKDYSQREIGAFLELPVTTVNNRLHAARTNLRERLAMASKRVGRVAGIHGPVVDVQFAPEEMPLILGALALPGQAEGSGDALQVVQRVGHGLVRCLARGEFEGIAPGAQVVATDGPMFALIDAPTLTQVIPILGTLNGGSRGEAGYQVLETGIKAIDLLCPFARGGTAGFYGPAGCGRQVISAEVLRNTARDERGVTIIAFAHGESEARGWYDTPEEVPHPAGAGQMICLPIKDPIDVLSPEVLAATEVLDARICLSFHLAKKGIWPAIDPLLSISRLMDPAIVGQEHYEVAMGVRQLLRRQRDLLEGAPDGRRLQFSADDLTLLSRASKVQRFFSQPFAVAEPFTGRPGRVVPLAETIRACKALLAGAYDHLPEDAFMWRGTIDEVTV
jgi:RNA polymerase sigma factor (sigma-70 family)